MAEKSAARRAGERRATRLSSIRAVIERRSLTGSSGSSERTTWRRVEAKAGAAPVVRATT